MGIVVLEADLELDGLKEVSLLFVGGVIEKLLDVLAHSGYEQTVSFPSKFEEVMAILTDCDFRHDEDSLPEELIRFLW